MRHRYKAQYYVSAPVCESAYMGTTLLKTSLTADSKEEAVMKFRRMIDQKNKDNDIKGRQFHYPHCVEVVLQEAVPEKIERVSLS